MKVDLKMFTQHILLGNLRISNNGMHLLDIQQISLHDKNRYN